MIKVLFFAQTRELIGIDSVELDDQFETVEAIRAHLVEEGADKNGKWDLALEQESYLLLLINLLSHLIPKKRGMKLHFSPPVTGG
ncbi:LOW QUALITY PROTEIN: molybdenum cofactor biosynthesis protein MoaD [Vibrio sp. JCM 18905]|nr:LOW QUALITY PROTEIN: molybdenum cofactor biosynthesis protein MoaD [Vibrio sp. JCM 18905]